MFRFKLEPYVKIQTLIVANLFLGQTIAGFAFGWTSPIIPKLKDLDQTPLSNVISDQDASWIVSLYYIGAIIGPHTVTFLSNFAGRKPCLLLGGFIAGISYLILALAKTLAMMFIGRVLVGFGLGIIYVVHLVYIGEIASTPIRGIFLSMIGFFTGLGLLLVNAVGSWMSYAASCYVGLAMTLLYLCGILFIPETPLFLVLKGKEKQAKKILRLLNREEDFQTIVASRDNKDSKAKWSEIVTIKSNRRALFIVISLHVIQPLAGYTVIASFVSTIFELSNSSIDAYASVILVGLTQTVAGVIALFFVERSGRRPLLLYSTAICFMSMGLLATYFYFDHIKSPTASTFDWIPLVTLITFSMSYALGLGIIPATFIGEMFTPSVRSAGATVTITVGWLWGFAMSSAFGYLLQLGNHVVFYVFTVACAVAFAFTFFLVPETKGKSLVEVQKMLS